MYYAEYSTVIATYFVTILISHIVLYANIKVKFSFELARYFLIPTSEDEQISVLVFIVFAILYCLSSYEVERATLQRSQLKQIDSLLIKPEHQLVTNYLLRAN